VEQEDGVDGRTLRHGLRQVGQADQQQQNKGYGGEQRVKGECAGEERYVVFIRRLEGPANETGGRLMPPTGPTAAQASGSSTSPGARRRERASASRRSSSSRGETLELRP
jgi:hypothetical protein